MIPPLATERLALRPIARGDAEALFPLFSDPEAMRFWSSPPFSDVEALRAWISPSDEWPAWVMVEAGEVVGRIAIGVRRPGVAEIGYALDRRAWGRGIAAEAVKAVIAHGFGAMGLRRIFADVDPDNIASIRLLERLGFALEGRLRAEWETHIGVRDSLIFGLLASDRT
ncbi:GNAT family protein [Sphingomonas sp. 1P06PA]|uniref:GNAT family N-acetyltransferase n=1 Tax=Sphingomonas sp. 1P06PA TaxID=554121 RepID=UPI0039A72143